MANLRTTAEITALQAQNRDTSIYLSDQRVAMFGSSRHSDIIAKLGNGPKADSAWTKYITDSTNATSISKKLGEEKLNFHLNDKYLIQYIRSLSGLVAYWPLNEISGDVATDYGASELNGDIAGVTVGQSGQSGKAYSFDGINDLVTITDDTTLGGMATASWIFMLKMSTITEYRKIIISDSFDFGINDSGKIFTEIKGPTNGNSGIWDNQPTGGIDDSTWKLIGIVYDGSQILGSINGTVVETTASVSGSVNDSSSNLVIGKSGTELYKGSMQHIALFNTALTSAQITKIARIAGVA